MNQEPLQVGDIAYVIPYAPLAITHKLVRIEHIHKDGLINCSWVTDLGNSSYGRYRTITSGVSWIASDLRKLTEIEKALYL